MERYWSWLPDRAVIGVEGQDAASLLQGLITQDIAHVAEGSPRYAMLLSPQGRYLFDFQIMEQGGRYLLDIERERGDALLATLKRYRLRARAELLDLRDAYRVAGGWGDGPAPASLLSWGDARLAALGWRMLCPLDTAPEFPGEEASPGAYRHHRMALGVPEGAGDLVPERSLPMEFGLEELGGVSFAKGCYVGQELTARSKHRGELRKGLYIVEGDAPLAPGTVMAGDREAGELHSASGNLGLALLRHEMAGAGLSLAGRPVGARRPQFLAGQPGIG